MYIYIYDCVSWESTDTSCGASMSGEDEIIEGQVNSPAVVKPKKPRQKAAHGIMWLKFCGSFDHITNIFLNGNG